MLNTGTVPPETEGKRTVINPNDGRKFSQETLNLNLRNMAIKGLENSWKFIQYVWPSKLIVLFITEVLGGFAFVAALQALHFAFGFLPPTGKNLLIQEIAGWSSVVVYAIIAATFICHVARELCLVLRRLCIAIWKGEQ